MWQNSKTQIGQINDSEIFQMKFSNWNFVTVMTVVTVVTLVTVVTKKKNKIKNKKFQKKISKKKFPKKIYYNKLFSPKNS